VGVVESQVSKSAKPGAPGRSSTVVARGVLTGAFSRAPAWVAGLLIFAGSLRFSPPRRRGCREISLRKESWKPTQAKSAL